MSPELAVGDLVVTMGLLGVVVGIDGTQVQVRLGDDEFSPVVFSPLDAVRFWSPFGGQP